MMRMMNEYVKCHDVQRKRELFALVQVKDEFYMLLKTGKLRHN